MARKPRIRQSAYTEPSAVGIGWGHAASATQRSDWGATRRSYGRAERSTAKANDRHAETLNVWNELIHLDAAHNVDEFAPGINPTVVRVAGPLGAAFEFALGAWLGWGLAGGGDPLLNGVGYLGPVFAAIGLGGVFAISGLLLGHGLGRSTARFIGREDSTNLQPTAEEVTTDRINRGVVSKRRNAAHAALAIVGVIGLGGYIYASTPREILFETASQPVDALPIAIIGGLIPLTIGLVKSYWYSREAAVRRHELLASFRRARGRWSRQHARAKRRRADFRARITNVIASAQLADANQEILTANAVSDLVDERMPLADLRDAEFAQPVTGSAAVEGLKPALLREPGNPDDTGGPETEAA